MTTTAQLIGGLGATELLIIGAIIVMMFGASKLPELARGSGQALRIFKSETKGLMDDDETEVKAPTKAPTKAPATGQPAIAEPIIAEPVVSQPVAAEPVTTATSRSTD